jgi:hypothetical protein
MEQNRLRNNRLHEASGRLFLRPGLISALAAFIAGTAAYLAIWAAFGDAAVSRIGYRLWIRAWQIDELTDLIRIHIIKGWLAYAVPILAGLTAVLWRSALMRRRAKD